MPIPTNFQVNWLHVSPKYSVRDVLVKDLRQVVIGGDFCYCRHMHTVINLFRNLRDAPRCIGELVGYLLRFVSMFLQIRASLSPPINSPRESANRVCKRRVEQKEQSQVQVHYELSVSVDILAGVTVLPGSRQIPVVHIQAGRPSGLPISACASASPARRFPAAPAWRARVWR